MQCVRKGEVQCRVAAGNAADTRQGTHRGVDVCSVWCCLNDVCAKCADTRQGMDGKGEKRKVAGVLFYNPVGAVFSLACGKSTRLIPSGENF